MNRLSLAAAIASAVAAIAVLVIVMPGILQPSIHIASDTVMLENKQIALNKRSDTNRTDLTLAEQEAIEAALAYPWILDIVRQKDGLYVERITPDNSETDCQSGCSGIVIGWDKPEKSSLYALVDKERTVVFWALDPFSGKTLG